MTLKWTLTAEENIVKITDYILSNFSYKETKEFLNEVDKTNENLLKFPHIGEPYKKTIYRRILISKQTYLYYRIECDVIILVTFFDNSQDPEKLLNILFS